MTRPLVPFLSLLLALPAATAPLRPHAPQNELSAGNDAPHPRRIVILKLDGLNADLLYDTMRQIDPASAKSRLPWFSHIFAEHGTIFQNFYTRGISLSAPSWSMLDTGRRTIIRGNVEYDRYTGQVYDYLNFVPFYIGYARSRAVDMPGVRVLDRAGLPLIINAFPYAQRFQSVQLFQRGVRWTTLEQVLKRRFSSKAVLSMLESAGAPSFDELFAEQTIDELKEALQRPEIFYLDFYIAQVDHAGHVTNQPSALVDVLRRLDTLVGRLWSAIQASPLAGETLLVVVSDHGMNNVPGVLSQTFSLPDLFASAAGGAHHVVTNRHQLSDFKLRGLDPLVHRVIAPSTVSFYLDGQASRYPTAWLDIDGNERTAVHLRNSDLNKLHILLLELARNGVPPAVRKAAARCLLETIDRHREAWTKTAAELEEEMHALEHAIGERKKVVAAQPHTWTPEQRDSGEDKQARRLSNELQSWEREHADYTAFAAHLRALLNLRPEVNHRFQQKIADFVPELELGDNNTVHDLQHYVDGPAAGGLVLDPSGNLDQEQSFRYVNYFPLLAEQRARNNPQPAFSPRPIDFTALRLPGAANESYWVYAGEDSQLIIHVDNSGRIFVEPVRHLLQNADGKITWEPQPWCAGLPLHLFEDAQLQLPLGADRAAWLSRWHTEREWLEAIHLCHYSNAVIGIAEDLSPVAPNVPGPPGIGPVLLRYERRRRELVAPDFEVFAADHWNFNVRFPNPGGNHGAFFRISTHSVWMMAGSGIPARIVDEPYDSLNFASTVLNLLGRTPPMPDRVVSLQ